MKYNIFPRIRNFEFSLKTKYWLGNCPIKTLFVNALSFYTPESERFFIRTVKPFYKNIHDPILKENVKNFIRQESNHQQAYTQYLRELVNKHYPKLTSKNITQPILALAYALGGKKMGLALTVIGEHFAAVLADVILNNAQMLKEAPSEMRHLLLWHCIEEIEHKAVVFDILKQFKGEYLYRIAAFFTITFCMSFAYFKIFWQMMRFDGLHKKWSYYKAILYFCWGKPGIFRQLIKPYFAILKPRFHPWQQNNHELIQIWENKLSKRYQIDELHLNF
ncbi:MAG: metal-dependent hydrolase [Proteobacteria bacterium]|nr:metal-dependent hydrolase [Pseudomonadota bacterium]